MSWLVLVVRLVMIQQALNLFYASGGSDSYTPQPTGSAYAMPITQCHIIHHHHHHRHRCHRFLHCTLTLHYYHAQRTTTTTTTTTTPILSVVLGSEKFVLE
jgi:hypothetical protein